MRKITLLLLLFAGSLYAQKSAPVAGHAARLIDLLKKDYNVVDPTTRTEVMLKDMDEVISLFKIYVDNNNLTYVQVDTSYSYIVNGHQYDLSFTDFTYVAKGIDRENTSNSTNTDVFLTVSTALSDYKEVSEQYNSLLKSYATVNSLDSGRAKDLAGLEVAMLKRKKIYEDQKLKYDLKELSKLIIYFRDHDDNDYLEYMVGLFIIKFNETYSYRSDNFSQANYNSSIQKALPFFGGDLTFEAAIDGLSRFLAKRIKEELTIHAIEKVKAYLNNPKPESYLNELMVLLPTTTGYLKSFDAGQAVNFTDDVKQYIEDDLNNLLENAAKLKDTPRFKRYIEQNPDLDFAFEALDIIPQISKIENTIDYFDILENSRNIQRWAHLVPVGSNTTVRYNIANSIKFANMLAHSLMIVEDGKPKFASTSFIKNYFSEIKFYLLYIGFLNQQNTMYYNVGFYAGGINRPLRLQNFMHNFPANLVMQSSNEFKAISENLSKISENAEKLHTTLTNIKKANKAGEKVDVEELHDFFGSVIDFSEQTLLSLDSIIKNPGLDLFPGINYGDPDDLENIIGKTKPYFTTSRTVNDIFLDLHQKKYTNAIVTALEIPETFRTEADTNILVYLNQMSQTLNSVENLHMFRELYTFEKIPDDDNKLRELGYVSGQIRAHYFNNAISPTPIKDLISDIRVRLSYFTLQSAIINNDKSAYKIALTRFKNVLNVEQEFFYRRYCRFQYRPNNSRTK